jgi:TniQ
MFLVKHIKDEECMVKITWNHQWVTHYESPWSIIEKLKYINQVSTEDVFNLFGNIKSRNNKTKSWGGYLRNLYTLEGLDDEQIKTTLGLSLKQLNQNAFDHLTNVLFKENNKQNSYFRDTLAYCPICLDLGHHSMLHQFKFINYCPYHMVHLEVKCNSCNGKIPYELTNYKLCSCGHFFSQFNENISNIGKWIQAKDLRIQCTAFKEWINVNKQNRDLNVYFLNIFHSNDTFDIPKMLNPFLDSNTNIQINSEYIQHESLSGKTKKVFLVDEQQINNEIYESTKSTFKAIARHFKKSLLKDHKNCIVSFKKSKPEEDLCPYAYAYIHWRKFSEDLSNHLDVENKIISNKRKILGRKYAVFLYESYLEKVFRFLIHSSSDITISQIIYIINKLLSIFLITSFWQWIKIAKERSENRFISHHIPFGLENLPILILEIEKKNNQVSIRLWISLKQLQN